MRRPGATPFRVALTIDAEHPDRPHDAAAELRLLATLERLEVRTTFFMQGRWVEAFPDRARRVADAGHLIGNHGLYHIRMPLLSEYGLASDIIDSESVIKRTIGVDPRPWFRCAFGAGTNDRRVQAAVKSAGYRHVPWHVEAEDWEPVNDGPAVAAKVVRGVLARRSAGQGDGSIVLLHSWSSGTADAMEAIVAGLRDAGAALARLDELEPGT